jgi:FKBP-type peptidyl-prolyl cis-trans isomerase SlyD
MEVHINNRMGIISRIHAGRVRVDFNSRWAGKSINYKYRITEIIDDQEKKLRAVIESDFGRSEEFSVSVVGQDEVEITLPDLVKLDSSWMMAKFKLVSDLRNHLGFRKIRFIEEYVRKDEPEDGASQEHVHVHDHDHEHEHPHVETEAKAEPEPPAPAAPEPPADIPEEAPKPKRSRAKKTPA